MDLQYEIYIFWSDEDGSYIAVAPEIPGCSAWGDTYEEALYQAKVDIRGHLKVARKYGRQPSDKEEDHVNDREKHRLTLNMDREEAQLVMDSLRLAVALRVLEAAKKAEESGGRPEVALEIAVAAEQVHLAFLEGMSYPETLGTAGARWGQTDLRADVPAVPEEAVRYAGEVVQEISERQGRAHDGERG